MRRASACATARSSQGPSLTSATRSIATRSRHSCASSPSTSQASGVACGSHQSMCVRSRVVPACQAQRRPRCMRSRRSSRVQRSRSAITASMAPSRPGRTAPRRGPMKALSRCACASTKPGSTGAPRRSRRAWPAGPSATGSGRTRAMRPSAMSSRASAGRPSCCGQSAGSSQRGSRAPCSAAGVSVSGAVGVMAAQMSSVSVGVRARAQHTATCVARSSSVRQLSW